MKNTIFVILFGITSCVANADTLSGKVISIADGDTLTIRAADNTKHKIRLAEIDAPEKDQPFGMQSRQNVANLCKGEAVITVTGKDRYKRVIGRVHCDGVDINLAQAQAGLAWVDPRYNKDLEIFIAVGNAREQRIGLWVDRDPMPPWAWRKNKSGS